jgi:hypothetical protein
MLRCGKLLLRAVSGLSLQVRTTHVGTVKADIRVTLKLWFTLRCRMAAKSPSARCCIYAPMVAFEVTGNWVDAEVF